MRGVLGGGLALLAAFVVAGCGTGGLTAAGADQTRGKELFTQRCGSCHILSDAGTRGTSGPNLDEAFEPARSQGFEESTIRNVVRDQISFPVPPMPPNLVEGEDADAVAVYVAAVAGMPAREGGGATTGGGMAGGGKAGGGKAGGGKPAEADGEEIFASAGCGSCHTFEAAGTTGAVGPNLDEAMPSRAEAIETITNGRGGMPPFKDQLSREQIEAVATFVSESAGK